MANLPAELSHLIDHSEIAGPAQRNALALRLLAETDTPLPDPTSMISQSVEADMAVYTRELQSTTTVDLRNQYHSRFNTPAPLQMQREELINELSASMRSRRVAFQNRRSTRQLQTLEQAYREIGLRGSFDEFRTAINHTVIDVYSELRNPRNFQRFIQSLFDEAMTKVRSNPRYQLLMNNRQAIPREAVWEVIRERMAQYGLGNRLANIPNELLTAEEFRNILRQGRLPFDFGAREQVILTGHGSEAHIFQLLYVANTVQSDLAAFGGVSTLIRFLGTEAGFRYWVPLFDHGGHNSLSNPNRYSLILFDHLRLNPEIRNLNRSQ